MDIGQGEVIVKTRHDIADAGNDSHQHKHRRRDRKERAFDLVPMVNAYLVINDGQRDSEQNESDKRRYVVQNLFANIPHRKVSALVSLPQDAGLVALPVALFNSFALIGFLLTFGKAELNLGEAALIEVYP